MSEKKSPWHREALIFGTIILGIAGVIFMLFAAADIARHMK